LYKNSYEIYAIGQNQNALVLFPTIVNNIMEDKRICRGRGH